MTEIRLLYKCFSFHTDFHIEIIKTLVLKYKVCLSELTLIFYDDELKKDNLKFNESLNINLISHKKAVRCDYEDYKEESIIPLDIEIFNQMKPYQNEIMSSIYRFRWGNYVNLQAEYVEHLKFWYWYLRKYKINLYIDLVPHEVYTGVIYYLSKILNIKNILIYPSPVYGSFILMNDWKESSKATKELYLDIKKTSLESESDFVEFEWNHVFIDFLRKQDAEEYPVYMRDTIKNIEDRYLFLSLSANIKEIVKIMEYIGKRVATLSTRMTNLLHPMINFIFSNYLESISFKYINNEDKYIYFPLHYQPECTTLPLGDVFENQLIAIEWLLYSKPKDVVLYVKEHPAQDFDANTIRYRSLKMYEKIISLPDVKFMSRNISTFELINRSWAVATITGTVGIEAIYKEKPVLMFGYHVYQYAPGVFPIRSLNDCSLAMEKIFKEGFKPSKRNVLLFLKALQKTSVPVNYEKMEEIKDSEKITQVSDFLYSFIQRIQICNPDFNRLNEVEQ